LPSSLTSFGRHALHLAAKEHVEQQRLKNVVAVVAQGDLGAAQLIGHAVQNAPAQAATQAAGGLALGDQLLDDAVGVFVLDVEGHPGAGQVFGQHMLGKARLLLVQVHSHQVKVDGRAGLELEQDVEQRIAVFAAGHAYHHLVAFFNHVEVDDGLAHLAAQALFQLVGFAFDFQAGRVGRGLLRCFGLVGPAGVVGSRWGC
jgi:hypothetical protein